MTQIKRDFRYEKDGAEIEAFQLTPATRYQESVQPAWFDSRWFMTVDNEEWLNVNGQEMRIPKYGWIARDRSGNITVRDAMEMEAWHKVVPDKKIVHPRADKGISDAAIAKAHKIELPPDHVESDSETDESEVIDATAAQTPPPEPTLAMRRLEPEGSNAKEPSLVPYGYLTMAREAFLAMAKGKPADAEAILQQFLLKQANWCDCPPGRCEKKTDQWDCRQNSPLAD
jgi:hypothetical protein